MFRLAHLLQTFGLDGLLPVEGWPLAKDVRLLTPKARLDRDLTDFLPVSITDGANFSPTFLRSCSSAPDCHSPRNKGYRSSGPFSSATLAQTSIDARLTLGGIRGVESDLAELCRLHFLRGGVSHLCCV